MESVVLENVHDDPVQVTPSVFSIVLEDSKEIIKFLTFTGRTSVLCSIQCV